MSAKKRIIRNIVIAVVVISILIGVYIFVSKWEPAKGNDASQDSTGLIYVVNEENVDSILVVNKSGEYSLTYEKNGDSAIYDISPLSADDKNMGAISSSFKAFQKILAIREISSGNENDFGFNESGVSVTLKKSGSEDIKLVFGDAVPGGGEYYCINKKDNKIYTVSDAVYTIATNSADYYRIKSVLAISDVSAISNFELYRDGKPIIKLRYTTEEENALNVMGAIWTMEYPRKAELLNDRTTELLTKLSAIYGTGFSEDNHSYKYRVSLTVEDKIYSFDIAEGKDEAYTKNLDSGIVYTVDKEIFSVFESVEPTAYINKFVNLINIENLSSVTIRCGEKEYTMEVDKDGGGYKINGSDIDEKSFKKKYQDIIAISFIDYIDEVPKGEEYMTIDFRLTNGEELKTIIYDYSEREYMVVCPNGIIATILKSEIGKIEEMM